MGKVPILGKSEKTSVYLRKILGKIMRGNLGIILVLVVLVIVFRFFCPEFLSVVNIMNIGRQSAVIGIIAAGMTFVIVTAGIDLSVGATVAFSGVIVCLAIKSGIPWILASLIALLIAGGIGFVNGYISASLELPPLLITLGTMNMIRGLGYLITNGRPVWGLPESFSAISVSSIFKVPMPALILVIVYLFSYFILKKTVIGINIYAVGDNIEAARVSGIKVKKIQIFALTMCGILAGLSGIVTASRLFSGQPMAGMGYELDAIASVVLGGTSLMGGQGSVWGSLIGAMIIGVMHNGLNLMGVSPYLQIILVGSIIVLAVVFDKMRSYFAVLK
jgi:ribose/xylose/arabinose/galactoside ABC-type transport system permease subunit